MTNQTSLRVYAYVKAFMRVHRYPPTVREIARGCGLGTTTVLYNLNKLEADGRIRRKPGQSRTITLIRKRGSAVSASAGK